MTDLKTRILDIFDANGLCDLAMQDLPPEAERLADQLVALFNGLNEHNACDFDCDNCHMGGCGNPLCERMGCPEENAARVAYEKTMEGHTILKCPICKTVLCEIDARWNSK